MTEAQISMRGHPDRFLNRDRALTERELEVLQLVSHPAMTIRKVARKLQITPKGVDHHLGNVRKKLDVRTTMHAVAEALRQGVIR